ncbi:unnamed protein product [Urochloa decumbens]|uniref:Uncharacterized protein n=1 Tax=Urochloa decumbens TaxID=240449 RepID=A0ABC9A2X8_9POAL
MAPRRPLLQLCAAVAAASCLCLLAATFPVVAAPPSRDASSGARRLGPAHRLRVLSDIPADAPAPAADDYDIPADAPAAAAGDYDYDYDIPAADASAPAAGDGDMAAGSPAPVAGADAAAGHSPPWTVDYVVLLFLAGLCCVLALELLLVGLIKGVPLLASAVANLYAAAKTAREKATRVRPVDQDAVEAAGGH